MATQSPMSNIRQEIEGMRDDIERLHEIAATSNTMGILRLLADHIPDEIELANDLTAVVTRKTVTGSRSYAMIELDAQVGEETVSIELPWRDKQIRSFVNEEGAPNDRKYTLKLDRIARFRDVVSARILENFGDILRASSNSEPGTSSASATASRARASHKGKRIAKFTPEGTLTLAEPGTDIGYVYVPPRALPNGSVLPRELQQSMTTLESLKEASELGYMIARLRRIQGTEREPIKFQLAVMRLDRDTNSLKTDQLLEIAMTAREVAERGFQDKDIVDLAKRILEAQRDAKLKRNAVSQSKLANPSALRTARSDIEWIRAIRVAKRGKKARSYERSIP